MPNPTGIPVAREVKYRFFELIHSGYTQRQAAAAAGVSESAGCRWLQHAGGVSIDEPARVSARFLSLQDRIVIADGTRARRPKPLIAEAIGKSVATVYREIERNSRPNGVYDPYYAHNQAYLARRRDRPAKIEANEPLREQVHALLAAGWSPGQIAGHLAAAHPDQWHQRACAESIYQAYYAGLVGEKKAKLRTGRRLRTPHTRAKPGHAGPIPHMTSIRQRPAAADDRSEPGHWEGDLIIGKHQRSQIGTLVCRHTRYLKLIHLPHRRTGETMRDALVAQLADLPAQILKSLTWDQGSEMARHRETTELTGMPVFFCDPHSPWQRPTNENTNGLLRQYFPKSTDLSRHTLEDLRHVEHLLNTRPRRVLEWATPEERMAQWIPRQHTTLIRNH
ncbi:IS30 family transposase [Actinospica robiniae]|uniref:IS30 family transposase n=1 Tax=Actinospica robiniae TaxID=304901 RepID=UPI00068803FC